MSTTSNAPAWVSMHEKAAGEKMYIDPDTGYSVMTRLTHLERGYCCGNACRHCPYNYINVGKSAKEMVDAEGRLLSERRNRTRQGRTNTDLTASNGDTTW